ncbi:hypothetical protein Barb7_03204 [Bacteroidales bacterium Barb7]|nr:hypothetical protein Barb7_03204 [Bacteroidales bacterium Barb7]
MPRQHTGAEKVYAGITDKRPQQFAFFIRMRKDIFVYRHLLQAFVTPPDGEPPKI